MIYVAIDTETTGLGEKCQLLELAMVLEDTSARPLPPVEELPHFVSFVAEDGGWWEPFAMGMHAKSGLLAEWLAAKKGELLGSLSNVRVGDMAASWLVETAKLGKGKLTPAGKNFAGFDARFLPPQLSKLLHHRALDPGSVFVDFGQDKLPGMNDLIDYEQKPGAHRALEDARDVVRVLRKKYT